jgi:multidrug resistance protein
VAAVLAATLVAALDQTVVGTVMPTVIGELGGIDRYAWVFSAYLLLLTVATPISGRLADLVGRKPVYLAGLAVFVVGSALVGLCHNMDQLVLSRAVQGAGAGALFAVGATVIGDLFDPRMRARMQGVFSGVWTGSALVGPAIGSALVETLSWRWAFYLNVPVGLAAAALLAIGLRETHVDRQGRFDVPGAVALSGATVSLLLGLSGMRPEILMPAAVVLAASFVAIERRVGDPLIDLALLRIGPIGACLAMTALVSVLLFGVVTYLPPFVQGVQGARPIEVGILITAMSVGWSAGSVGAGAFLPRVGTRGMLRAGTLSLLIGAALLVSLDRATPLSVPAAAAFASGIGIGSTWTAILVAVQSAVPLGSRGIATSLALFTQSLGAAIGVGSLGALLALSLGADASAVSSLLDRGSAPLIEPARALALAATLAGALHRVYEALAIMAVVSVALAFVLTRSMPVALPRDAASVDD